MLNVCSSHTIKSIMAKLSRIPSPMRFWVGSNCSCELGFSLVGCTQRCVAAWSCVSPRFKGRHKGRIDPPAPDEALFPRLLTQAEYSCFPVHHHFHGFESEERPVLPQPLHVRQVVTVQQQQLRCVAQHGRFADHATSDEPDPAAPRNTHEHRARQKPTALPHPDVEELVRTHAVTTPGIGHTAH